WASASHASRSAVASARDPGSGTCTPPTVVWITSPGRSGRSRPISTSPPANGSVPPRAIASSARERRTSTRRSARIGAPERRKRAFHDLGKGETAEDADCRLSGVQFGLQLSDALLAPEPLGREASTSARQLATQGLVPRT